MGFAKHFGPCVVTSLVFQKISWDQNQTDKKLFYDHKRFVTKSFYAYKINFLSDQF